MDTEGTISGYPGAVAPNSTPAEPDVAGRSASMMPTCLPLAENVNVAVPVLPVPRPCLYAEPRFAVAPDPFAVCVNPAGGVTVCAGVFEETNPTMVAPAVAMVTAGITHRACPPALESTLLSAT